MEYYNYPPTNEFGVICHYDSNFDSNEQIYYIPRSRIYGKDHNSINKNSFMDDNAILTNLGNIFELNQINHFNYDDDNINSNNNISYSESTVKDTSCDKNIEITNDTSKESTVEKTIASNIIKKDDISQNRIFKNNDSILNLVNNRIINEYSLTNRTPILATNNCKIDNNIVVDECIINNNIINNNTTINEGIINNNQVVNEGEMNNNTGSGDDDISNSIQNKIMPIVDDTKPKKKGRKSKGHSIPGNFGKKARNKFSPDNMRLKFKRAFTNYLIDFINFKMGQNPKLKNKGKLKKLNDKIINDNVKKIFLIG